MDLSIRRSAGPIALAIVLSITSSPATAARVPDPPEVTCNACYLVDDTGGVLFARAAAQTRPNASTTKMATALVVVDATDLRDRVTISADAAATGGGGLDLAPGDTYRVEMLLQALLMTSSNDAAVALAEHVSGSESAFVETLNDYLRSVGARDSVFVTAHGLDMPGHGASARDLALLADLVLDHPILARIVGDAEAVVRTPKGPVVLENRNVLLEGYRGATGVKTGYTASAGNVLVASAERDGRRLIAVAMDSVDATADARALLDYGWRRLSATILLPRGAHVGALVFDEGATEVATTERVTGAHDPDDARYVLRTTSAVDPPIAAGEVVGQVDVVIAGSVVATVDAVASGAVPERQDSLLADAVATVLGAVGRWFSA